MKLKIAILSLIGLTAYAQTKPLAITGGMTIQFATRSQTDSDGKPKPGVKDTYTLQINVADSVSFHGNITNTPFVRNMIGANQNGSLDYSVECDVFNPKNLAQTRNVGRLYGPVPVDERNVYRFADGALKVGVLSVGTAKGFESRFNGLAVGKPPANNSLIAKAKKEALRLTGNKGSAVTIRNYDLMALQNHIIAAGPVAIYPEVSIAGDVVYDYDRSTWFFKNISAVYAVDGHRLSDSVTGTIRWIEDPNRKSNGQGRYDFDVRVNEPLASEAAAFNGPADESSFFAQDDNIPTLSGSISYKDTMSGERVTGSVITIDLKGNKLTKQQLMWLAKLIFFTMVVPFNAE